MADETQNPNIIRTARNKPEPSESADKGIGGAAGWIYFLIAVLFDVIGALANGAAFIGSTGVMLIGYLIFIFIFLIFSGVNVFSKKYLFLFAGSLLIEIIPIINIFPGTSVMVSAIVSKSRSGESSGSIKDVMTLATNKITRGKGSAKSSAFVERARRKGGDKLARSAQTRVALREIKSNLKNRAVNEVDGFGGNVAKSTLNRIVRSKRESPKSKPGYKNETPGQNKVLNLSSRDSGDDFSQTA